jgi:hypothetical protein
MPATQQVSGLVQVTPPVPTGTSGGTLQLNTSGTVLGNVTILDFQYPLIAGISGTVGYPQIGGSIDILGWNGLGATVSAHTTGTFTPYAPGVQASQVNAFFARQLTLRNLTVRVGAQSSGGSLVFAVVVNGVDSSLVVTIPASSPGGAFSDTTHSVVVSPGTSIRLDAGNNAAVASATIGSVTVEAMY